MTSNKTASGSSVISPFSVVKWLDRTDVIMFVHEFCVGPNCMYINVSINPVCVFHVVFKTSAAVRHGEDIVRLQYPAGEGFLFPIRQPCNLSIRFYMKPTVLSFLPDNSVSQNEMG